MGCFLNVTALFAGIGGLELGLERAGHKTTLMCESAAQAVAVLRTRFPRVAILPDVRDVRTLARRSSGQSSLLTAGFPCTDLSQAGRTLGFDGSQSVLIRPTLELAKRRRFDRILVENVPNWRVLHGGQYFDEVIKTLEKLGYIWAYRTIDAYPFGVPQRRRKSFYTPARWTILEPFYFEETSRSSCPNARSPSVLTGSIGQKATKGLAGAKTAYPR